jgi:hypothetical protein
MCGDGQNLLDRAPVRIPEFDPVGQVIVRRCPAPTLFTLRQVVSIAISLGHRKRMEGESKGFAGMTSGVATHAPTRRLLVCLRT